MLDLELALARRIQLGILPDELPSFAGYSFLSRNVPSRGVSGDFYTLTLRAAGEECLLFMGDVSGKGFSAALVTASVEALSAAMIEAGYPPHEICSKLSHQLFDRTLPNGFVTAFIAALDRQSGRLVYTNAGHNTALLAGPTARSRSSGASGCRSPWCETAAYESREVLLDPGATLLLYTDGITEAANSRRRHSTASIVSERASSRQPRLSVSSQRAPNSDPLNSLAGDLGDSVVVGVVVQDGGVRSLGRGCDDQVGDLHTAVMKSARLREPALHLKRPFESGAVGCNEPESGDLLGQCVVV